MLAQLVSLNNFFEQAFPAGIISLNPQELLYAVENLLPDPPEQLLNLSPAEIVETMHMAEQAVIRTGAIDAELQNITVRQLAIEAMMPQLESALSEAVTSYTQIESGKMAFSIQLAKAQMQLESGRSEIEKGLTELEDSRNNAVGNAGLDGKLTPEMISTILMAQNFAMPAGYIGDEGHVVKVSGNFDSVSALENAVLFTLDSTGDVLVSDVANIEIIDNATRTYARVNGNEAVVLSLQKQSIASTTAVSGNINATIADLSDQYAGLRVLPLMDQGENINIIISSVWQNLLIGGIIAILILLFFLKDYRPTLIIAFSIPISLLFAITLMYFSNVTLNIISLSGLALGVGMLVDNSIVVIENIYRMRNEGEGIYKAAVQGAREVGGALFAATMTTVCVFLPIVFTQGLTRQLFSDMGLTIAYSLVASLIVALTLIPVMASAALKRNEINKPGWFERFVMLYGKLLYFSLKYKAVVLIFVSLLLGLSIYGITIIETSFMPEMESAQMSASLTMPPDSSTEDTYSIGDKVQERILEIDEVTSVGAMGNDPVMQMGFSASDISFYILLRENRTMTNAEVAELILEKTADIEGEIDVSTSNMDMSVLVGNGIEVVVKGNSLDDLFRAADEVASILLSIEGVAEVSAGDDDRGRETRIEVDKNAAMREGLTVAQVFREIAGVLSGETRSTTIRAEQGDYPVIVAGPETESLTRENIRDYVFMVTKQDGTETEVLLSDVAIISDAYSPSSIRRDNQSRYISVTATLEEGYNIGLISRDIESRLAGYTPPQGMMFEIAGETEMIENAIDDIILMVLLAIILIYLIMVAQFQSLLSPFIILLTIPLAFTGGLLLLWVTGIELSLPAMLGFLILIGVVVNNGIVYIDYVNKLRAAGRQKRQALIETGMVRVRPILMTTLTTVLAMTPIALGLGSGSDATQPMAVVAIGGLTYATLLTLLVVPIMYDLLNRKPMRANQLET